MADFCEVKNPRVEELTETELEEEKETIFTRIAIEETEESKQEIVHIHDDPGVYTISNYITKEECDHMINLAKPHFAVYFLVFTFD